MIPRTDRSFAGNGDRESNGESLRLALRGALMLSAIGCGVLLGLVAMPLLLGRLPHDLARLRTILTAVRNGRPALVVFGDSRAEAAIDARLLTEVVRERPLAYNLASHSQTVGQAILLSAVLPASVQTVVLFVTPQNLQSKYPFDDHTYNTMVLYGYRPDRMTADAVAGCFERGLVRDLTAPRLKTLFEARWILRQFLDTATRRVVRTDIDLRRERTDIYFPSAYLERVPASRFGPGIAAARAQVTGSIHSSQRCALRALAELCRKRHQSLILAMPPVHPHAITSEFVTYGQSLKLLARSLQVPVVDLSQSLTDADYADPLHASRDGARKVTMALASAVERGR